MPFRDWDEVTALPLPIRGKTYRVPPMSAAAVLRYTVVREAIEKYLADLKDIPEGAEAPEVPPEARLSDEELFEITLGPLLTEMRADGVPEAAIIRAALVVIADEREGRDVAEYLWEHGPSPEALAASMQAANLIVSSMPSPNGAEASGTRSPARTNGTKTSPRRSSRTPKGTAPRMSPGRKSPGNGHSS